MTKLLLQSLLITKYQYIFMLIIILNLQLPVFEIEPGGNAGLEVDNAEHGQKAELKADIGQ